MEAGATGTANLRRELSPETMHCWRLHPFYVKSNADDTGSNQFIYRSKEDYINIDSLLRIEGKDMRLYHVITFPGRSYTKVKLLFWNYGTTDLNCINPRFYNEGVYCVNETELGQRLINDIGRPIIRLPKDVEQNILKILETNNG